jgi:hypothetical protein
MAKKMEVILHVLNSLALVLLIMLGVLGDGDGDACRSPAGVRPFLVDFHFESLH